MNIEYLTWPIIRYKCVVLFGWVDLLVSFGDIAGLFLGFSLLSGVDHLLFHITCMLYALQESSKYQLNIDKLKYFYKPKKFVEIL